MWQLQPFAWQLSVAFSRYLVIFLLFLAAALGPALLERGGWRAAPPLGPPPPVPTEALEALRQGRYWRASRILRGYLAKVPEPTPETLLLAAQAEAGWGDWASVERLLAGRSWLDSLAGGYGWNLLGRSQLALGHWDESEQSLARFLALAAGGGERERGLTELRRGLALSGTGNAREATQAFRRAARLVPQMGDWIAIFEADAAAKAADTAAVRKRLASTEPFLAREWGWRILVRARTNAKDLEGAQRAAEMAANDLEDAMRRAEAWQATGDLRLLRGDAFGARVAFRRAMAAAPQAVAALDAARKLSGLPGATPEDQLRIGRLYLRHGNFERGIAGLEAYVLSGRGSSVARAEARLDLARAYFRAEHYAEAERRALALAAEAPSPRIGAEALFLAGRAQYRQGRGDAGRATYLRTAQRFPHEAAAAEALFLVADMDHDDGRLASAREFYRRTAAVRPGIDEAGLALMRLGGMAYAEKDYKGAAAIFEEYRRHHPDGKRYQQATYWAAKAYRQLGEKALARARLRTIRRSEPFSWYGIRAAEMLGEDFWDVPLEASPPASRKVEEEVAGALVRLDLLRELEQEEAAAFEVDRLKRHLLETDGALYALAEAFNARGYTFAGIKLGWEIYRGEGVWNRRLLRIIYPFPYQHIIMAEARERGIDPFLVAGLIRQESMFNATIKSPVGAVGLMQIMPTTGEYLARTAGLSAFSTALLERPEINLHLGVAYVAELMGRFGKRLTSVLAAYNAGPHRVARWSAFPEYIDEELFAERIPYSETREYVKIVQQNALLYEALYGSSTAVGPKPGD